MIGLSQYLQFLGYSFILISFLGIFDFLFNILVLDEKYYLSYLGSFFEHFINGFTMSLFMTIIFRASRKNPVFLHTLFWGMYSLSRSIFGGLSGAVKKNFGDYGLNKFTMFLVIPPIILSFFLYDENEVTYDLKEKENKKE